MTGAAVLERLRGTLHDSAVGLVPGMEQAAVLILLDNPGPDAEVVLTQRAEHMRLHPGEIAFPGGRCDEEDEHLWATALREAWEEIGLEPDQVRRLGMMEPLITRSQIQVTPCVGLLSGPASFVPNPDELDAVFTVPLAFCAKPGALQFDEVKYRGRVRKVPRYDFGQYTIWGITAAMLVKLTNLAWDAGLEIDEYWKERQNEIQP